MPGEWRKVSIITKSLNELNRRIIQNVHFRVLIRQVIQYEA